MYINALQMVASHCRVTFNKERRYPEKYILLALAIICAFVNGESHPAPLMLDSMLGN